MRRCRRLFLVRTRLLLSRRPIGCIDMLGPYRRRDQGVGTSDIRGPPPSCPPSPFQCFSTGCCTQVGACSPGCWQAFTPENHYLRNMLVLLLQAIVFKLLFFILIYIKCTKGKTVAGPAEE